MASIPLAAYALDPDTAAGIAGVRVRIYGRNLDNTRTAAYTEVFTDSRGYWSATIDTAVLVSPSGYYEIEEYQASTNKTRIIHTDAALMFKTLSGNAGAAAPLADLAVTTAKIADLGVTTTKLAAGAVSTAKLAADAATDTVIGNRQADQAIAAASSSTGTLTQLLSWIVKAIKAATGTTNWYDAPATTLAAAASHAASTANPHGVTAAQVSALALTGGSISGGLTVGGTFTAQSGVLTNADKNVEVVSSASGSPFLRLFSEAAAVGLNADAGVSSNALPIQIRIAGGEKYRFTAAGLEFRGGSAVVASAAGNIALPIRGAAAQTADLLSVQDSAGAVKFAIGADGRIKSSRVTSASSVTEVVWVLPIYTEGGALAGYIPVYNIYTP